MKTIERLESAGNLSSMFMSDNPPSLLISKMAEFEYVVIDVMKGKETSHCVVGFNFEDSVEGTIEINMVKEEKEWRIDSLDNPHFDKLDLS